MSLIHESFPVGAFQCNCSILACARTREAVVVDPGDEKDKIVERLQILGLKVTYLLHTHAHFDHVGASSELSALGFGRIALHKDDLFLYERVEEQGRWFGLEVNPASPVEIWLQCGDEIEFGDQQIKVLHTPGHTPGSLSFLVNGQGLLFTGDTLFKGSIGRTDLPGGDSRQIIDSIRHKLLSLKEDQKIIPGHGPATSLFRERQNNPFLIS